MLIGTLNIENINPVKQIVKKCKRFSSSLEHSHQHIIIEFEKGLNPADLDASKVEAQILGYGEISTVFQIDGLELLACKRMPLFEKKSDAEAYERNYRLYCRHLSDAGITIPNDYTLVVENQGRPVTLYIIQDQLQASNFAHKLIHTESDKESESIIRSVVIEIKKIWDYNRQKSPDLELALDGQLSNWVKSGNQFIYIDTSTPLFKIKGIEQLDPELFLKSAPSFLRWLIRWLFLQDVMDRYYNLRQVLLDLAGNLYKENKPELIPAALKIINDNLDENDEPIIEKEVTKYYKEDKLIWALFLALRRFDRLLKTTLFRQRYEYILPGNIER
ncbi:MAG: hypothetical protein IIB95_09455 [Candidatus Marinimicrobia bacterium]|nr:hypothetical protein [Candidatus Neomarinimicrobiota bacterium]